MGQYQEQGRGRQSYTAVMVVNIGAQKQYTPRAINKYLHNQEVQIRLIL